VDSAVLRETTVLRDAKEQVPAPDALTATAPPHLGASTPGVLAPTRVIGASARVSIEGLMSARGRENVLPPNPSAVTSTSPLKCKPAVRNGVVCYTAAARYATPATPMKGWHGPGKQPSVTSRITQAGQPQQGQRVLLTTVPTPGVPATVWKQPPASAQVRPSGITRRRASAPGAWPPVNPA